LVSPAATLTEIERAIDSQKPGAYLRFGDGDLRVAEGLEDRDTGPTPKALRMEMSDALRLEGPGIFRGFPLNSKRYGLEPGMYLGVHEVPDADVQHYWRQVEPFISTTRVYSSVALHYLAATDPTRAIAFLRRLRSHTPLFVGNKDWHEQKLKTIFGDGGRVGTLAYNSWPQADRITADIHAALPSEFTLIVMAAGVTGRVLQKRLVTSGVNAFVFDFGSLLDAMMGRDSRTWIRRAPGLGDRIMKGLLDG